MNLKNNGKTIVAIIILAAVVVIAGVIVYTYSDSSGEEGKDGSLVGNTLREEQLPSDGSRLWVYGNANEDDVIDSKDITYLEAIINGSEKETVLADANCDGVIDEKDVEYLNRIIAKEKMKVYYIDNYDRVASVSWPVESIAIGYCSGAYCADLIGICDKVTMVDNTIANYWTAINSNFSKAASYGTTEDPDYERMIASGIDVYLVGYCDYNADKSSPGKLNPAGIDVMFLTTCDNSGVDRPNEFIDRTIVTMAYLLQGNMDKVYEYLDWHDDVIETLEAAAENITDKTAYLMARTCPESITADISITGLNNTNNIHAEWVGVYSIGMHEPGLSKNYQTIGMESIISYIEKYSSQGYNIYYMENCHAGLRQQYDLIDSMALDAKRFANIADKPQIIGMAREAGNSPLYVIELAFMQNAMYPELNNGLDYKELFEYYFNNFSSENYYSQLDINQFFAVYNA